MSGFVNEADSDSEQDLPPQYVSGVKQLEVFSENMRKIALDNMHLALIDKELITLVQEQAHAIALLTGKDKPLA